MKKFIVLIGNYGSGKTEIAINLAVKSVSYLEVHKVSRYLNGQLIDRQRSKCKPDIVQIGEISTVTVFRFAEIVN